MGKKAIPPRYGKVRSATINRSHSDGKGQCLNCGKGRASHGRNGTCLFPKPTKGSVVR